AGDPEARRALGERLLCVPRLVAAIDRRRGGRLDAEGVRDVAQDALVRIWQKLDSFAGTGSLESWVYRFCHYEYMNHVRQRARRSETKPLDGVEPAHDLSVAPIDASYSDVERAIDELGPPEATIIRMRHEDGRSFDEIGPLVDLLPNTAKTRYYRGLARLRRRLAGKLGVTRS
ncbi:MAG: RNA polymerase sigma factor, partial [Planctomycetota bacterium]